MINIEFKKLKLHFSKVLSLFDNKTSSKFLKYNKLKKKILSNNQIYNVKTYIYWSVKYQLTLIN